MEDLSFSFPPSATPLGEHTASAFDVPNGKQNMKLYLKGKINDYNLKIDEEAMDALASYAFVDFGDKNESSSAVEGERGVEYKKWDIDTMLFDSILKKFAADASILNSDSPIDREMIDVAIEEYFQEKSAARLAPYTNLFGDGVIIYDSFKDVFDVHFDAVQQKFIKEIQPIIGVDEIGYHANTSDVTTSLFNKRFDQILKRTKGHPKIVLALDAAAGVPSELKTVISMVDSISYSNRDVQHFIGLLKQDKDGDVCIQGLRIEAKLAFTDDCVFGEGIYGKDHVVLVQGHIRDGSRLLYVTEMMHPPRDYVAEINEKDIFGGGLSEVDLLKLKEYEWQLSVEMNEKLPHWVILSEVHLNDQHVLLQLEKMLDVYTSQYPDQSLPTGFVLMGNFCSTPFSVLNKEVYQEGFENLYKLLTKKYETILMNCYILFIPGPQDACFARQIIPRAPILPIFTNNLKERLEATFPRCRGKIIFATNPCRARHLTHKMIFFRNDVFNDLLWDSIKVGGGREEASRDAAKILINTIVGQSHIYPIKVDHRILKRFDQSMRLYPLPNLICLADVSAPFFIEQLPSGNPSDSIICNTDASFSKHKTFMVFDPSKKSLKRYKVPPIIN